MSDRRPPLPSSLMVLKFGGTSVASPERWAIIGEIVRRHRIAGHRLLLVCSAAGDTSDHLEALLDALSARPTLSREALAARLDHIRAAHLALAKGLGVDGSALLDDIFDGLAERCEGMRLLQEVSPRSRAAVMANGELMSTRLGAAWLTAQGFPATWLDARELLSAEPPVQGEPEPLRYLSVTCDYTPSPQLARRVADSGPVCVTQGFIASDAEGDTVLLGRGGSDTSAAYLAVRLQAAGLEIWTDVAGLFTADPRHVPDARPLDHLSFRQAEVLSALGARVLHPRCIEPARVAGIPVRVRSTLAPEATGTTIGDTPADDGPIAVLTRRHISLLTMKRPPSWQPVGFIAEVSACFQAAGLSIDLFAASPEALQATIDLSAVPEADAAIEQLMSGLQRVCTPTLQRGLTSLSVVGTSIHEHLDRIGHAYGGLTDVSPHMVVHGAGDNHVTFVLSHDSTRRLCRVLHDRITEPRRATPAAAVAVAEAR